MLKKHHPSLYDEILKRTQFLDANSFSNGAVPMQARLYCLEHDLHEHPMCHNPTCHNTVGWCKANLEFQHHCCNACSNKDPDTIKKAEETNLRNLGVRNAFQSEEKKEKIRLTNLKNLGVENPSQSEEIKKKKSETTLKHLGVKSPAQSKEVMDKIIKTCNERYGGFFTKSKIIQNKIRNTNLKRRGVETPFESQEVRDKTKRTWIEKYGVDNPWKQKIRQFWINRFGVDNFSKTPLFSSFCRKRIFHDGIWFDSNWEIIVYEFCKLNQLDFIYSPKIVFQYEYDGRNFTYHPDFIINGKIYEVKGNQFFRTNSDTGEEEMFIPYGRKRYGEKLWKWKCAKEEAKHQCMLKNNVRILRDADIQNLNIEMFIN